MGTLHLKWSENQERQAFLESTLFAMAPVRGVALQLGTNFLLPLLYINNGVLAGGNYPVQVTVTEAPTSAPVISSKAELFGVLIPCVRLQLDATGKYECWVPRNSTGGVGFYERGRIGGDKAFLTMPTGCHGPLSSTMEAESWEEPGNWAKKSTVTHNAAGTPVVADGLLEAQVPGGNQRLAGHQRRQHVLGADGECPRPADRRVEPQRPGGVGAA